jgi:hypothetical protein
VIRAGLIFTTYSSYLIFYGPVEFAGPERPHPTSSEHHCWEVLRSNDRRSLYALMELISLYTDLLLLSEVSPIQKLVGSSVNSAWNCDQAWALSERMYARVDGSQW